ncbi:hypothetical protein C8R46DRAFT_1120190 [Mycena filopes]|nr:hypothetical protein C8R46DRAFT_1120190 [Mycena filopes]
MERSLHSLRQTSLDLIVPHPQLRCGVVWTLRLPCPSKSSRVISALLGHTMCKRLRVQERGYSVCDRRFARVTADPHNEALQASLDKLNCRTAALRSSARSRNSCLAPSHQGPRPYPHPTRYRDNMPRSRRYVVWVALRQSRGLHPNPQRHNVGRPCREDDVQDQLVIQPATENRPTLPRNSKEAERLPQQWTQPVWRLGRSSSSGTAVENRTSYLLLSYSAERCTSSSALGLEAADAIYWPIDRLSRTSTLSVASPHRLTAMETLILVTPEH